MRFFFQLTASLTVLLMLAMLSACGSTQQEREEAGKPLSLEKIERRVRLNKQWDRDIGKGQGKHYNRLTLGLANADAVCGSSVDGKVSCFDAKGKRLWQRNLKEPLSAGAGVSDEQVLVATANGHIVALSRQDGSEVWRIELSSEVLAAPQGADSIIVVQTSEGRVVALDASSGDKRWEYNSDEPILTLRGTATPVIDDAVVYTGFASGKIVALDLNNGALLWDQPVALAAGVTEIERIVDVDASPKVGKDSIFAGSFNGNLFAFSRQSGAPQWRFESSTYREVDEGFGNVYLVDEQSRIYAINEKNGEQRWEQSELLNRELSAPVVFAGYLLVADYDGYIHVLSQVDGAIVGRKRAGGSGIRVPMREADGQLYVYSNNGKLSAYTLQVK